MNREQILEAVNWLGLPLPDLFFDIVRHCQTPEKARSRHAEIEKTARRKFKHLARQYHPDLNGGDEAKTETFKTLATVINDFAKIPVETLWNQLRPRQVFYYGVTSSGTTSSSSVTFTTTIKY